MNQYITQIPKLLGSPAVLLAAIVASLLQPISRVLANDWMTWPSTYTHDSRGVRVDQYAVAVQPQGPNREDVVRSGFRHFRSTLQAGQSADNYHVTEQWGAPVVPYEHWRFPFRPFGVPYDAWGPPTPYGMFFGAGANFPFWQNQFTPGMGGPGMGGPGMGGPGMGGPGMGGPGGGGMNWPGPGTGTGTGTGRWPNPWQNQWPGHGGFPLQPQYQNQPWFDGTYPDAPPLDNRSDREFFWKPGIHSHQ